jgi:hypothetical protein
MPSSEFAEKCRDGAGMALALRRAMEKLRRLHMRVNDGEYHLIRELATERKESMAAFLRHLVRVYRLMRPEGGPDTSDPSPLVETGPRVFG